MEGKDTEGELETVSAGEQQASHHAQWWGQVWLQKQEEEGLLDGKFQVPQGIVGKKEMDTVETEASEVTEPEELQEVSQVVPVWETEDTEGTVDTVA